MVKSIMPCVFTKRKYYFIWYHQMKILLLLVSSGKANEKGRLPAEPAFAILLFPAVDEMNDPVIAVPVSEKPRKIPFRGFPGARGFSER